MSKIKYKTRDELESELEELKARVCEWDYQDDMSNWYMSKCGFSFQFSDERESATDCDFNFCPKCGGKIVDEKTSKK